MSTKIIECNIKTQAVDPQQRQEKKGKTKHQNKETTHLLSKYLLSAYDTPDTDQALVIYWCLSQPLSGAYSLGEAKVKHKNA